MCKRALESAKVNVVEAPRSYVIATANLHAQKLIMCNHYVRVCILGAHNCVAMLMLAVMTLVCFV